MSAFFTLHDDLPREGPGTEDDVAWAAGVAGLGASARICDAGSGPGGDIAALLDAAPAAQVTAIDAHAPFVEAIRTRWGRDSRVTAKVGDMAEITGPFDFIWSAGAVYFLGVTEALRHWRGALAPGGAVAFSEPCWFVERPSETARAFWGEYTGVTDAAGIDARVRAAGFETRATRPVSDAGWDAYFGPIEARVAALRPGADADLTAVLDEAEAESAHWRAARHETGYLISVVMPR